MPFKIHVYNDDGTTRLVEPLTKAAAITDLGDALDAYKESYIDPELDSRPTDAPSDNKSYARKNGAWVEVTQGGVIPDPPPMDGRFYAMTGAGWIDISSALSITEVPPDALPSVPGNQMPPLDGHIYAMMNQSWVDISDVVNF